MTELERCFADYRSTEQLNDLVWTKFGKNTDCVPFLKEHRDWIEQNSWGFGDRALHYMWYLLLRDDVLQRTDPRLLEIGVYKGQVISLWALIASQLCRAAAITAVSPFESAKPWFARNRILSGIAQLMLSRYRDDVRSANLYESDNYLECVHRVFRQFNLPEAKLSFVQGFSQDPLVLQQLAGRSFDVIYVDGGHRYKQVAQDLTNYSHLVAAGGYIVLDDASYYQPGSKFWKGHESVSRAVEGWNAPSFANVLNVGHNRVYKRTLE